MAVSKTFTQQLSDVVEPVATNLLPCDKAEALRTLYAHWVDKSVRKDLGFAFRHARTLLWPKSMLQAAGIFSVVSGLTTALTALVCVGLTILGIAAALLGSVVLSVLIGGACVGWASFIVALFVSCGAAIATFCAVAVTLGLMASQLAWQAAKRGMSYLFHSQPLAVSVVDVDMKSARMTHEDTPILAAKELTQHSPVHSGAEKHGEDVDSLTDGLISSSCGGRSELDKLSPQERAALTSAEIQNLYAKGLAATSPGSSAGTSPIPGLRTLSTATHSDTASHRGSVQSAPPIDQAQSSRRSNKKMRGGRHKKSSPPADVAKLMDASFQGDFAQGY